MTEPTLPGKGNVHKLEPGSSKKRSAKKSRTKATKATKATANSYDPLLLKQIAHQLFSGLLKNDTKHSVDSEDDTQDSNAAALEAISKYVAFVSRGKAIGVRNLNTESRIGLISHALANGVCINGRYNRRDRLLQPYGIIVREPKIYLLAVEHADDNSVEDDHAEPVIKQYLCHRFEHLSLTSTAYSIPDSFKLQDYIDAGHLEQSVVSLHSSLPEPFELVLRLHDAKKDNLLRDLEELPLGRTQSLIQENNDGSYQLKVPGQRATHELLEWILARQERVEVISPAALRQYVVGRLHATANRYIENDQFVVGLNGDTTDDSAVSQNVSEDEILKYPRRSKYATNNNTNTVATWMVVRLLDAMRITSEMLSSYDIYTFENCLPTTMQNHLSKSATQLFAKAARKLITDQKEPEFDISDPFTKNTAELADFLNLNEAELAILRVSALLAFIPSLHNAVEYYLPETNEYTVHNMLALLNNQSAERMEYHLRNDQTLRSSGLILRCPHSIIYARDVLKMSTQVAASLFQEQPDSTNILNALLKRSSPALTTEADLEHLSNQVGHASRLIQGSTKKGIQGTNILLWGAPGTGKTQLARYLGQSLGLGTYEVPTISSERKALTETERFSTYQLCQSLLAQSGQALLIFDEVENIIDAPFFVKEELPKAYINQALDDNPTPSIWISNHVSSADAAYLRRFDYAIEIKQPDRKAKLRMAKRILGSLPINGELLDDFLERQEVGPAMLSKLKRVADISGADDPIAVDALALSIVEGEFAALGAPELVRRIKPANNAANSMMYDPSMINTDIDIENFADHLQADASVRLCLYGPPGTGKTAWAKQLAKDLSVPAHVKQLSDIKNKYVGESEAAVASAFTMARAENAVLIFDEVDSYLRDRQNIDRSHEADLVNQFLTSLENHDGIVVCTTNFIDSIDTAALRRFDYKIKFDYLRETQANSLLIQLAQLLGIDIDSEELRQCNLTLPGNALAPGDFAAILRRSQSSTHEMTIEEIHAGLLAEAEFRNPQAGNSIGFV